MTALRAPRHAWPTMVLTLAVLSLHIAIAVAAGVGAIPLWSATLVVFVLAFAAFTPMHDSSHRSVSRNRRLNDWIGRLASLPLGAPFAAFRYVHLEHHKHTNDPELDPDHYAGRGPWWSLPLRWLSQDLHYYSLVLRRWGSRPVAERAEVVLHVTLLVAVIAFAFALGHGTTVIFAWLLPARLAIAALSFAFDYLPHVPHQTPAKIDRFKATRILIAPGLTAAFLYQNYHLIHHLYPGVPFYRYRKIWDQKRSELRAKGARVWELSLLPTADQTVEELT